ncbi:MAG: glutamate synthase small subunit [Streptosporangiales bacterium]|nr:glutamate synthase small subunit [Streptosporangiales bacterium]
MADPKGFLNTPRRQPQTRPVPVRIQDWREIKEKSDSGEVQQQAGRCMACGIPYCHRGCPLGNLIPEWNDLVWRGDWQQAAERLHATNNFPEFTGRLCPAPCEPACVLDLHDAPVTIKQVEVEISDRAWERGQVVPRPPDRLSGRAVAVVGSGPAGLAAAQQLTRAGHTVVVYERDDRLGGLLRYGVPEFKMEKRHIEHRLEQMRLEGTRFKTDVHVGVDVPAAKLRTRFDAVLLANGALAPREVDVPGRELAGVHQAMDHLTQANRVCEGDLSEPEITAKGKRVVIVGGGDTGEDCLGTAHRQGATSVVQLGGRPQPPDARDESMPWPREPDVFEVSGAYEEGGEKVFSVTPLRIVDDGNGNVAGLEVVQVDRLGRGRYRPIEGTERIIECDLVLLALGFTGPEPGPLLEQLEVAIGPDGNVVRDEEWQTSVPGVYVAGDAGRGASLVVWAIAEGRAAAAAIDRKLTGVSQLPRPVTPASTAI